ncbi:MAG TPA: tetratricopeptide repeat protein [Chitinophagaceae bacterium]|nr:tetratricopeptide repeat protein [Chitinophagaceae bacterium]
MKCNFQIVLALLFWMYSPLAFSQTKEIDSLKRAIAIATADTNRINLLNELSYNLYMSFEYDSSLAYGNKALKMAREIGYEKGEGYALLYISCSTGDRGEFGRSDSLTNAAARIAQKVKDKRLLGLIYHSFAGLQMIQNHFNQALKKYDTALKYYKEIGDKKLIALIMRAEGMTHFMNDNYPEAIRYTYEALKYFEEIKDEAKMAECYAYIGFIYKEHGDYEEAIKNYSKAMHIYQLLDQKPVSSTYHQYDIADLQAQMGEIYLKQGDLEKAVAHYSFVVQILEANMKSFDFVGVQVVCYSHTARGYELMGDLAQKKGDIQLMKSYLSKAENNYERALEASRQPPAYNNLIADALVCLAKLRVRRKEYPRAESMFQEALALSSESQYKYQKRDIYLGLSSLYESLGNEAKAFANYKKYILYRDSIANEESNRKIEGYKAQFEFGKQDDKIRLLTAENDVKTILASKQKQQKSIAYGVMVVILLTGGYGFYRYRRKKKQQRQQAVLSERLRISSELHDEVGATLSGIAMYSHLTKEQMKAGQTAAIERSLDIMQESSVQMVDKLNDIVWFINPQQDSLQQLITRLEEYATTMAAIKNMQVMITVPGKLHDLHLPVENRRNIYLFCKEAINNAVKYSGGTILQLVVIESAEGIEFSVSDNGKGFDAVMVRRGNGLENMQKRADEIGAKLVLQSKEMEGASVSLQYKLN